MYLSRSYYSLKIESEIQDSSVGRLHDVDAIIDYVRPTHFVTISLLQGRRIPDQSGALRWLRGDDVIYSQAYSGLIRSASKLLTPRSAWKSHKPLLPNAGAIEGGRGGLRNHLHFIVSKPCDASEESFRVKLYRAAFSNPWVMSSDDHAVHIQKLETNSEIFRATAYTFKCGLDRVLLT